MATKKINEGEAYIKNMSASEFKKYINLKFPPSEDVFSTSFLGTIMDNLEKIHPDYKKQLFLFDEINDNESISKEEAYEKLYNASKEKLLGNCVAMGKASQIECKRMVESKEMFIDLLGLEE